MRSSHQLRYKVGQVIEPLNLLDHRVQFKKLSQAGARRGHILLERFIRWILRGKRMPLALQESPEDARYDGAPKMAMKFGVQWHRILFPVIPNLRN